jgi:hypothetical protein
MKRTLFALALSIAAVPAFAQDIISTVVGNGTADYSGDGGQATSAGIFWPQQVALIPGGGYYLGGGAQVRKIDANGTISTVAGNSIAGFSGDGGPATAASLSYMPSSIRRAADGSLYLADYGNFRVRKIGTDGIIRTVAGNGSTVSEDGVPATSSGLLAPTGVDIDAAGNLYISEYSGCRVRKVDTRGIITTVVGTGVCSSTGDGGAAKNATLDQPWGVRLDTTGNLYIGECNGNRIRKVDKAGNITTVPGSLGMDCPMNMDFDSVGNLYTAVYGALRIYRITPGGVATVIAGNGSWGFSGDGGAAISAQFNGPRDVTVAQGRLYIADGGNNRLRVVATNISPQLPSSPEPEPEPATTCASEGYRGTQLQWCMNICESGLSGRTLDTWIQRWLSRYRELPYCAK